LFASRLGLILPEEEEEEEREDCGVLWTYIYMCM